MAEPPAAVYSYIAIIARLEVIAEQLATARSAQPATLLGEVADSTEDPAESSAQAAAGSEHEQGEAAWNEVEGELRRIADGLRQKEHRQPLGNTSLPSLIVTFARLILLLAPHISSSTASAVVAHHTQHTTAEVPSIENLAIAEQTAEQAKAAHDGGRGEWAQELDDGRQEERRRSVSGRAAVVKEIGRVAANLCIDDDENRDKLALYQYPAALVQLLQVHVGLIQAEGRLEQPVLGAFQGLVGSALNAAVGESASVKAFLLRPGVLDLLLSVYQALMDSENQADNEEGLHSLALWIWRTIGAAASDDTNRVQPSTQLLQIAIRITRVFLPATHSSATSAHRLAEMAPNDSLLVLSTACALLERAYVDVPTALSELVRTETGPSATYLQPLLEFAEHAAPIASWEAEEEDDEDEPVDGVGDTVGLSTQEKWEKQLGLAKASVLRILVELSGEVDVSEEPNGWLRETLFTWLDKRSRGGEGHDGRPDLVGCALLCFGNYARTDAKCIDLLSSTHKPPLLPAIRPLLRGSTDVQVQHALVGLLKNLAIPKSNKALLGKAGIIEGLCDMGVWLPAKDTVGSVQGGGVGVAKHLCFGHLQNALRIANSVSSQARDGPLRQLMALFRRTDDAAIRCEIARVVVNITRTLYGAEAAKAGESDGELARSISEGKQCMASDNVITALLSLLAYGKTSGHAILVNEAVLALALSCQEEAGLPRIAEQIGASSGEPTAPIATLLSLLSETQSAIEDGLGQTRQLVIPTETKLNMVVLLRLVSAAWQAAGSHEADVDQIRTALRRIADDPKTEAKLKELLQ